MRQPLLTILALILFPVFLVCIDISRRFGLLDPSPTLALLAAATVISLLELVGWLTREEDHH
jgi:hypothetical protein